MDPQNRRPLAGEQCQGPRTNVPHAAGSENNLRGTEQNRSLQEKFLQDVKSIEYIEMRNTQLRKLGDKLVVDTKKMKQTLTQFSIQGNKQKMVGKVKGILYALYISFD